MVQDEPSIERFTDNGDGTITDNLTGLEWMKDATSTAMTWQEAIDYCKELNKKEIRHDWELEEF
ncbi:MAG: DUF1566 domain-containing protein [Nitrospirae bacterium]|nr:DUF1566 domain-containing protein [Nitrospirota bacterium]